MMTPVTTICASGDNFIYLVEYERGKALIVDPGESAIVLDELDRQKLIPTMILVTHHHYDHVAGVGELRRRWPCKVIGPDTRVSGIDVIAEEMPVIGIGKKQIEVILTPGHTSTAVSYYIPASSKTVTPMVFTGDTMFMGGCGRVLEGVMEPMYRSLKLIASLPEETLVYPGHDYTEENYEFALTIKPKNEAIKAQLDAIDQSRIPPSTIAREKETNIFLLAKNHTAFAKLRRKKDAF